MILLYLITPFLGILTLFIVLNKRYDMTDDKKELMQNTQVIKLTYLIQI